MSVDFLVYGRLGFAALCLAATTIGVAAEDLYAVYRAASAREPVVQAARRQFDATAEKLVQARAAMLPGIALNASANRQQGEASFNDAGYADRTVRSSAATLQLNQPLWRPALRVAHTQAELQVQQARLVLQQAETELILRVSQAYFDALVAQEGLAVAENQVNAVEQQLALAQRNFETGQTTVTDVHEAQARLELARAQRTAALTELSTRHAEIEKLLGYLPQALAPLAADALPPALARVEVQAWIDSAQSDNLQVRAQRLGVEIARQEVAKMEKAHWPTLDATAGYGRNASTGSMTSPSELASRSRAGQVGLQLTIPLYAGGGTQSRVREALALQEKAEADLETARRQATVQVRQAFAGVVNGQAQVEALAAAVKASKAAVNSNKMGYKIGTRINIDVLNAEQQQFVAQRDLHKARADTIMQGLRLKATDASLTEDNLQALGALLKAEP